MSNVIKFSKATQHNAESEQPLQVDLFVRGAFLMLDISLVLLADLIRNCPAEYGASLWRSYSHAETSLESARADATDLIS